MFGRKKRRTRREELAARAGELADKAKEVGGHSGEALKEFADKARVAARELVDSIDKAARKVQPEPEPETKKSHKLRVALAIGIGVGVLSSEKARNALASVIRRSRGDSAGPTDTPEIWRPPVPATASNGQTEKPKTVETN